MKIAYIIYYKTQKKISSLFRIYEEQARAAQDLGLDVSFFVLNNHIQKQEKNIYFINIRPTKLRIIGYIKQWFFKYHLISKIIDLNAYDKIILRYPLAIDFSHRSFFKRYPNKIVTVHHTDEVRELSSLNLFWKILSFWEAVNAPHIIARTAGIVGVTDEIRKLQLSKIKSVKPSVVISNGIEVEKIALTGFKPFDGNRLNLIFMSSIFSPWHGLDRLLHSLDAYNGKVQIELTLIGNVFDPDDHSLIKKINNRKNVSINLLGHKSHHEIDSYFAHATIAVSSLCFYRIGISEACPLKTREYLARGIPFIYAYKDPDIHSDNKYVFKTTNDNSLIDIFSLIDFACAVSKIENVSGKIREIAKNNVDWKIKMAQLHSFVAGLP